MKLVVFETEEWEHAACLALPPEHELVCTREPLNAACAVNYSDAEGVTTFVNPKLNAGVLAPFPKPRLIATRFPDYDHIDLDYSWTHGITVSNVPDHGGATVAEHAFPLWLAISRLVEAIESKRQGDFFLVWLRGFDLRGKTLGVISTGRIGRRAIEIGKGFGMEVEAFEGAAQALGFRYADLLFVLTETVSSAKYPGRVRESGRSGTRKRGRTDR